jgi:hypothetical protein
MNFSKRLMILSLVPSALLVAAALVGAVALRHAEARFGDVFEKDQPLAQAVTEMYGHGLQTGQALRNILLDPANPTAYKNLDTALKAYDEAARRWPRRWPPARPAQPCWTRWPKPASSSRRRATTCWRWPRPTRPGRWPC